MLKSSSVVTVKLSGVNLNRIYKECLANNIKLYNIDRQDYKNILFDVSKKDLAQIKQIAKKQNYQLFVIKQYALAKLFSFVVSRIGILIGVAIFLFTSVFSSFFVWNVKIYGNTNVTNSQILDCLKQNGINVGSFFAGKDLQKIEENLIENLDQVSLCSIIKKGTSIVVNIKEKLDTEQLISTSSADIIATQNMTIKSLQVVQGTALKKVGDTVKAGETIVAGYFVDSNGNKISCRANAKISATIWFSKNYVYPKTKEVFERTNNKAVQSKLSFFGLDIAIKNQQNTFEFFDEQTTTNYVFNNNFLPIKICTTTFYQTKKVLIEQNFEQDKDKICKQLQDELLQQIPQNLRDVDISQTINENENSFSVSCYAQIDVEL